MPPRRVGKKRSSAKPEWTEEQRSAIRKRWFVQERMIERSHNLPGRGKFTFSLYYFVKDFTRGDKSLKDRTILFVAGGPGQIVSVDAKNFIDMAGYRIAYFHLRGTGFSQLPADNAFDRFLRTAYAVEDIEEIRNDLKIDKWYGIIGHSYGCVLAQQYARKYPARVNKLILSAPQAVKKDRQVRTPVQQTALQKLYESEYFAFLDNIKNPSKGDIRDHLVMKVQDISAQVDRHYWNMQYIVDNYEECRAGLRKWKLDYGKQFFMALRYIRLTGWLSFDEDLFVGSDANVDTVQRASGLVIAKAILGSKLERVLDSNQKQILKWGEAEFFVKDISQTTPRAYYVISIYDGLSSKFLEKLRTTGNIRRAISNMGGVFGVNNPLRNVGIVSSAKPKPWRPGRFKHGVSALILKGGADPVTEAGQAEDYFRSGFTKDAKRALVELPGIGHAMTLPALGVNPTRESTVLIKPADASGHKARPVRISLQSRQALIHNFLSSNFQSFKKAQIFNQTERAIGNLLGGRENARHAQTETEPVVSRQFLP